MVMQHVITGDLYITGTASQFLALERAIHAWLYLPRCFDTARIDVVAAEGETFEEVKSNDSKEFELHTIIKISYVGNDDSVPQDVIDNAEHLCLAAIEKNGMRYGGFFAANSEPFVLARYGGES